MGRGEEDGGQEEDELSSGKLHVFLPRGNSFSKVFKVREEDRSH